MSEEKVGPETPTDEKEFSFSGEPESITGQETAGSDEPPSGFTLEEVPDKKGGPLRLLLLLVLVIGGAGAGFYLFGQDLFSPDTPVTLVQPQKPSKMKVPARLQPVEKPEAVKEEVVSAKKIAAVVTKPVSVPAPPPASAPAFALTAGSYLYQGWLSKAITQVERMGYKVVSSKISEAHEMTRLLVGVYGRPLAEKRLAEVKKLSDGAFLAAEEGKFAVYAGSFLSLDKARRWADLLYQQGVIVRELQVKVDLPRTTLRFGSFATRGEAQKVVSRLTKLGVKKLQIVPFK